MPISWSDNKDDPSGDAELFGLLVPDHQTAVQLRVTTLGSRACM